jgi:hypothetical protein
LPFAHLSEERLSSRHSLYTGDDVVLRLRAMRFAQNDSSKSLVDLALDDVEGEAGEGGFLIAGLHVEAGLVHGFDDLIE